MDEPPPRWRLCPKYGEVIEDTFVAFKVPLKESYDAKVEAEHRFHPSELIAKFKNIGLIIDLTKTKRYYDARFFEDQGIKHIKIECEGRGAVPTQEQVSRFIAICSSFVKANPGKLIGVHCTHGFNRTGYMICSYGVEQFEWAADTAVEMFALSRPPGIYKQHYIEEFFDKNQGDKDLIQVPEQPNWDDEDEQEEPADGKRKRDEDSEGEPRKRLNGEPSEAEGEPDPDVPVTIPGYHKEEGFAYRITGPKLLELRSKIQRMCNWRGKAEEFPGAQPVSLTKENIRFLKSERYMVSWKADGTRYMMLINADGVYLADRDFRIFRIPGLIFPKPDGKSNHDETLVDGELVLDKTDTGIRARYLIYDLVYLDGQPADKSYSNRLKAIEDMIHRPREKKKKENMGLFVREPFGIRPKNFFRLVDIDKVFTLIPKLPHENDGLVLAPADQPYTPGRDEKLLKWKPPHLNTIDFEVKPHTVTKEGCPRETEIQLLVQGERGGGTREVFGKLFGPRELKLELKAKAQKLAPNKDDSKCKALIIECGYRDGHWVYFREREDKSFPNALRTANNVMSSIINGVTEDDLNACVQQVAASSSHPAAPSLEHLPNRGAASSR